MKTFFKPFTVTVLAFFAFISISTKSFDLIPVNNKLNVTKINCSIDVAVPAIKPEKSFKELRYYKTPSLVTFTNAQFSTDKKTDRISVPIKHEKQELAKLIAFKLPELNNETVAHEAEEFELKELIKFKAPSLNEIQEEFPNELSK